MPIIGIAQVLVEPVTTGLQRQVSNVVGRSMPSVGRDAGQRLGKGMADGFNEQSASLEAEVNQLAGVVSKAESDLEKARGKRATARAAEQKALGDLRVAELKLQELRDTTGVQESKLAAAEERVSVTRNRATAATQEHQSALRRLSDSMASVSSAHHDSSRASEELATHLRQTTKESDNAERGFGRLGARLRTAFQGNPLQGMVESIRRDRGRIVPDLHQLADDVSSAGTRGGRAFTQAFTGVVGGLSLIPPAAGAAGAALVGASGNVLTLGASLGSLAGVAALVPAGLIAIGAGAGVMISAFSGIGDALKAATDQQQAFTANPRIAAMAVQDAAQQITVAEENAARAQESAARRVQDAKRSLRDTIGSVAESEKSAAEAVEAATRRVRDAKISLQDTIERVAESERNAAEAIESATQRIVDAKQSLKDAVESAAESEKSAAEAVEAATRRVRDAKISLQDTVERVAESQKSAAQAISDAQRREVEATQDVIKAQKELADVREKANAKAIEAGKKLSAAEQQAAETAKALQVARELYDQTLADPKASVSQLNKVDVQLERAKANDEKARKAVIELAKENKTAQDAAKKSGDAVLSAQERLDKARQNAADAARATQEAQERAAKAQRDGVRSIADAQERITDALKAQKKAQDNVPKAAEQAARRVKDAQRGVVDAIKGEKDARADAVKAAADGIRSIADAQEQISDAIKGAKDARADAVKTGTDGARSIADAQRAVADATKEAKQTQVDSARAVEQAHRNLERVQMQQADQAAQAGDAMSKAMSNLTPSAAEAVRAMLQVKDQLSGIRRIAQENFFKGFAGSLLNLSKTVMPQLAVGVGAIATALGSGAQTLMNSLSDALGGGVLTGLLQGVATTITILNKAIDPLVQSFVTLGVVGMDYMPRLAEAIANMATSFNNFIQDAAASGQLDIWIEAGIQGFKDLGSIVGSVVGIFSSLTKAAEAGGAVSTLGGLAEGLRNIDSAMQGETFQTTMSTIFAGAEAGSQGLLKALTAIGEAFVTGAPALADFLRLGGEIAGTFIGGIFTALSNPEFGAGLKTFMEAIQRGVENLVPLLPGLTTGFGSFLTSMAPIVEKLGPTLIQVFTGFGHAAGTLLNIFSPLLNALAGSPLILGLLIGSFAATAGAAAVLTAAGNVQKIAMAGWAVVTGTMSVAQGVLAAAFGRGTAAIATNKAAMVGYKIAAGLGTAATWLATAAQRAFNLAMRANPIGLVITAIGLLVGAVVWLYKNNETARNIINAVWASIKNAIKVSVDWIVGAWRNVSTWLTTTLPNGFNALRDKNKAVWDAINLKIDTIWLGIKGIFTAIKNWFTITLPDAFQGLRNKNTEVWNGIKKKISDIWTGVKGTFNTIKTYLKDTLGAAFGGLKTKVTDVFNGIKSKISDKWTEIKSTFSTIKTYLKDTLGAAFGGLKTKVTDVFNGIKSKISDKWTEIKDTLGAAKKYLTDTFGPAFTWLRDSVIKPVWNGIKNKIKAIWEDGIKPVFTTMQKALKGDFTGAFRTAKDAIEKIWNGLKSVAKKPIEFIIKTVINDGLIGAFNKVAGFVDPSGKVIKKLKPVALPKGFAHGGWTGPGSKYQEAGIVHADEYVVKKESQRSIERKAPGFLDSLNNLGAKALGYATGGLVRPLRGGRVSSGFGASRGRYPHAGQDFATPVGTPIFAAMDGFVSKAGWNAISGRTGIGEFLTHDGGRNTYYGHLSKLLVKVGDAVKAGQQIALSGNTGRSTGPHLHFETWTGGKPVNPAPYLNGATLPSGSNSEGGGFDPLSGLTDLASNMASKFADAFPGGGKMVDIAQGIGGKLVGSVKDWAFSKVSAIGDFAKDSWNNVKSFFTGGKSDVKNAVQGVANGFGWGSGGQWKALSKLISKESSWNPKAQNPSSTAYGLFQFLNSTWAGVGARKTSDPAEQARAGLKYIQQRYGDPQGALAFHDRNNWYAEGGQVKPTLYDNGGVLPVGLSSILNYTRKPEAILTGSQWADMHALASRGGQQFPDSLTLVVDGREFTAYVSDVADGRMRQAKRDARRGNRQMTGH